jgi:hypothetical protein
MPRHFASFCQQDSNQFGPGCRLREWIDNEVREVTARWSSLFAPHMSESGLTGESRKVNLRFLRWQLSGRLLGFLGRYSCITLHTTGTTFATPPRFFVGSCSSTGTLSSVLAADCAGSEILASQLRPTDRGLQQACEPLSLEGGNHWGFPDPAE